MKVTKTSPAFSKWKATYLLLALAILAAMGGYGWRVYALYRDWQLHTPQPQVERLVKDLRSYHAQTKQFPTTFAEINAGFWRTQPPTFAL